MSRSILALALGVALCGCATGADLRPLVDEHVPKAVAQAIDPQRLSAARSAPVPRGPALEGWTVASFQIEPQPPFHGGYKGKEFLIEVDPNKLETDRYVSLSTKWMESHCQAWALALNRTYETELKAGGLTLAPVQCHRLVTPDGRQVFDVITFAAERGEFADKSGMQTTGERLGERFSQSISLYGPWTRLVEPAARRTDLMNGIVLAQAWVHRYTYLTTFMHAEFGKSRRYDSYVLMLLAPRTLTVVQTFLPPELREDELWPRLATVIGSLDQGR